MESMFILAVYECQVHKLFPKRSSKCSNNVALYVQVYTQRVPQVYICSLISCKCNTKWRRHVHGHRQTRIDGGAMRRCMLAECRSVVIVPSAGGRNEPWRRLGRGPGAMGGLHSSETRVEAEARRQAGLGLLVAMRTRVNKGMPGTELIRFPKLIDWVFVCDCFRQSVCILWVYLLTYDLFTVSFTCR